MGWGSTSIAPGRSGKKLDSLKESLHSPKPKEIESKFNKGPSSVSSVAMCVEVLCSLGWLGTGTVLNYWSLGCWANGTSALGTGPSHGLDGTWAGLGPQRLHDFCSEMELSHLVQMRCQA